MVKRLHAWIKKKNWWFFPLYTILVVVLTFISYRNMNKVFYSSDEWIGQGVVYNYGISTGLRKETPFIEVLAGRGRPLTFLLISIYMYYFSYNVIPFVITACLFHIINGLLFYLYLYKISKNMFIGFIGGIFFVTAHAGHQSITWIVNSTQDPIAVTCILLSQLYLIQYIERQKKKFLFLSVLAAYVAFLFKDAYFYIFVWLPIFYILFIGKKITIKQIFSKYWPLLIGIFIIIVYKMNVLQGLQIFTIKPGVIAYWQKVGFNWLYYSYVSLSQTFIPQDYMFKIAKSFLFFNYRDLITYINNIDVISQNIISDLLSSIFSFIFLITITIAYVLNRPQRKTIIIGGIFYILSFSTIAVFLLSRNTSYIESRYLYTGMISMGIFFAVIIDTIKKIVYKTKIPVVFSIICLASFFLLYFSKQVTLIQREVNRNVISGQNTKNVLLELSKVLPVLPDKPIIYLTGSDFYYGYVNLHVPLQLNPGYVFMIWYYKSGKIPKELLPKEFSSNALSSFGGQWYEEYGDRAFGYYWDKEGLRDVVKEKNINSSQLIGLYYDGKTKKFKDITDELQSELFNR